MTRRGGVAVASVALAHVASTTRDSQEEPDEGACEGNRPSLPARPSVGPRGRHRPPTAGEAFSRHLGSLSKPQDRFLPAETQLGGGNGLLER